MQKVTQTIQFLIHLKQAYGKEIDNGRISDVEEISGHGVIATVDGKKVMAGNIKLMKKMDIPCYSRES
jgi:Cd2+/Zn2+-exporting ATPase